MPAPSRGSPTPPHIGPYRILGEIGEGTMGLRPAAARADDDLLVLRAWEETSAWLLNHTARWPKAARFTLTQRIENHALDVLEKLVEARYEPKVRRRHLQDVNLRLERLRFLFRTARDARVENTKGFETAMRKIDEVGRMVHGWRVAIGARPAVRESRTDKKEPISA